LDIVALVSKKVGGGAHVHRTTGRATSSDQVIYGSMNKDYGSSGLSIADVNQDGLPDIIFTNGDGFELRHARLRAPGTGSIGWKTWVSGKFTYHKVGDFSGRLQPHRRGPEGGAGTMDIVC
jgi:hypothetical protein